MPLTKPVKAQLRENIFRHLDGIATAPSAYCLHKKGIADFILREKEVLLSEITKKFSANEGYLNVALRIVCSQGWLTQEIVEGDIRFSVNDHSEKAFELFLLYDDVVNLLKFSEKFHRRKFEAEPFQLLEQIINKYYDNYGLVFSEDPIDFALQEQVLKHIEGILIGPTIVHLGMSGMFHKYFMEVSFRAEEFHNDPESFTVLLDFLAHLNWFEKKNDTYRFTETGFFFAQRASAYGVTVSYIPTFRHLDELIFGDPTKVLKSSEGQPERHVDREMNVWGSGGAHINYFKVIDEIIIEIFNKPLDEQPKGILDMGCGNGAFLKHMFEVIELQTLRGKHLDGRPLFLVGADFNEAALKVTRSHLIEADIWAKVIWGDIGRPDLLAKDLKEDYDIDLSDLLNVRTFLDHNRIWEEPETTNEYLSESSGAYATLGRRLPNNLVEESLVAHFKKWTPYVSKFGLLLIELHTIPPHVTAANIGRTPATAYDGTHGFSDQYILEADVFLDVAKRAGLISDARFTKRFPDSELCTVTINLMKGNSE